MGGLFYIFIVPDYPSFYFLFSFSPVAFGEARHDCNIVEWAVQPQIKQINKDYVNFIGWSSSIFYSLSSFLKGY